MLEEIKSLLEVINQFLIGLNVNKWYLILWISAGYSQKQYLPDVLKIGRLKLNNVWKTFLLGTLLSLGYVFLNKQVNVRATWIEFFASYVFTTSMYEMWVKDFVNSILSFFNRSVINKLKMILNKTSV